MVMTVRELIKQYRAHQPGGVFFNRDVLSFWGERIHEMSISGRGSVTNRSGDVHICWELRTVQRHPMLGCRTKLYYFDVDTYEEVMPEFESTTSPWILEKGVTA